MNTGKHRQVKRKHNRLHGHRRRFKYMSDVRCTYCNWHTLYEVVAKTDILPLYAIKCDKCNDWDWYLLGNKHGL